MSTCSDMIFSAPLLYIKKCHTTSCCCVYSIIQLRLTVDDLEFRAYLQAGQAKVQLKSEK